jgi:hypothetical protein
MAWMSVEGTRRVLAVEESPEIPTWLLVAGAAVRVVFIACLLLITLRVSMPQNETIWTVYDTPGDLVRMLLGLAVCAWIAFQLFRAPKDARSNQTFLYFGLAAVPFVILCLVLVW